MSDDEIKSLQQHFHLANDCLDKIPTDYGLVVVKEGPVQCIPVSQIKRNVLMIFSMLLLYLIINMMISIILILFL